jgi:hypothetical protein
LPRVDPSVEHFAASTRSGSMVGPMFTGEIFGPDILLVLIVPLVLLTLLSLSVWAIVDVASHSKRDFYEAGYSRTAWIIVIAVFTFFYGFGAFTALFYLIRVRPKVLKVEARLANTRS